MWCGFRGVSALGPKANELPCVCARARSYALRLCVYVSVRARLGAFVCVAFVRTSVDVRAIRFVCAALVRVRTQ